MIGEVAALGAALCWAASAVLYRRAVSDSTPISANIVRLLSTSVILIFLLVAIGKFQVLTSLSAYPVLLACLSGIIGLGLGDTMYMLSLKWIGVARAVSITCTYPLFTLVIALLLQQRTVTLAVASGAVAIVIGIWLLTSKEANAGGISERRVALRGALIALLTAVVWAVSIALMNVAVTLPETDSPDGAFVINAVRVTSVALFLLLISPLADRKFNFLKMRRTTVALLITGGVIALALGWFLLAFSFLFIPEAVAVPISSTSPLFAMVSGILLLRERISVRHVAGAALIVIGISLLFVI